LIDWLIVVELSKCFNSLINIEYIDVNDLRIKNCISNIGNHQGVNFLQRVNIEYIKSKKVMFQ